MFKVLITTVTERVGSASGGSYTPSISTTVVEYETTHAAAQAVIALNRDHPMNGEYLRVYRRAEQI